ncbi:NAD(P)/FAD-dependent oxidoreductase [Saccharopolyspora hattusasensis]|uniref:NAD(P)/FAD-dependent oxidoreductase n=1 Tax=Saccharopolyspora hattusasensis TaxID=1128679 RepID=UPI003D98D815
MSDVRVVIVGGGVIGLFTAAELLHLGVQNVTVLEERHPGAGSSGRSVGMVETQYIERSAIEVRAFGLERFAALHRDHDLSMARIGYLRLAHDPADLVRLSESVAIQAELGIRDSTVLAPSEIASRWPRIAVHDRAGGLFGPSDAYVDGYEVCTLLVRLVQAAGGRVVSGAGLRDVESGLDGRVAVTAKGRFQADLIVNAAGGWAGNVGTLLGAPVPMRPQLHGAVAIELDEPWRPLLPFVMDYVPGSRTDGIYFRSERPDQLIAGLHTDEAIHEAVPPDTPLGPVSHSVVERITTLMAARLTDCDGITVGRSWTGVYPMTEDNTPIVGFHPEASDVMCALGAGGSGIQLSPAIARVAAETIVHGRSTAFSADPGWSPDRLQVPSPQHDQENDT